MQFDMEGTFGDDYLYFYAESIDDEHSDADTAEILALLGLAPGSTILDAPCGHGRLSRRLAAAGMRVTGVDLTHAYLDLARADPKLAPDAVTYLEGDVRALPVTGPYDAVVVHGVDGDRAAGTEHAVELGEHRVAIRVVVVPE